MTMGYAVRSWGLGDTVLVRTLWKLMEVAIRQEVCVMVARSKDNIEAA